MLLFQFSCVNIVLLLLKSLQRSAKQEQYPNTPEYLFCSYAEHFVPLKWNKDPPWLWVVVSNPRVWFLQRKMCVLNNNDHTGQEYRNHHLEQDWVWSFFWLVQQGQLESMKMIGGGGGVWYENNNQSHGHCLSGSECRCQFNSWIISWIMKSNQHHVTNSSRIMAGNQSQILCEREML